MASKWCDKSLFAHDVIDDSLVSRDELKKILAKIPIERHYDVRRCIWLMTIGYGWGKFGLSVLKQGLFTQKQMQSIQKMEDKITSHEDVKSNSASGFNPHSNDMEDMDASGFSGYLSVPFGG